MSAALPLTQRIAARRARLMQRMVVIQSRADAGECVTAWFEIDAIEEEMEFLLDLQRTTFLSHVRDQMERRRA